MKIFFYSIDIPFSFSFISFGIIIFFTCSRESSIDTSKTTTSTCASNTNNGYTNRTAFAPHWCTPRRCSQPVDSVLQSVHSLSLQSDYLPPGLSTHNPIGFLSKSLFHGVHLHLHPFSP